MTWAMSGMTHGVRSPSGMTNIMSGVVQVITTMSGLLHMVRSLSGMIIIMSGTV